MTTVPPFVKISSMIKTIEEKILAGENISKEDALYITGISGTELFELFASANKIRTHFSGNTVGLCSIVNAKSGACPEDCSFCAQSSKSKAKIEVYPLLSKELILQKAREAKKSGSERFSIVTSGNKVSEIDLLMIADMISADQRDRTSSMCKPWHAQRKANFRFSNQPDLIVTITTLKLQKGFSLWYAALIVMLINSKQ